MNSSRSIMIHCKIDVEDYSQYAIDEGVSLLDTYNSNVVELFVFEVKKIHPATYIRKGQVDQVLEAINRLKPDFIFWNHNILHRNQRELEILFKTPILDRTRVILEIFKMRASSSEEKLQVELAYKKYARTKLVRAWSHLERQRGSSSTVGGPGERQLELDRRMLDDKIKVYTQKLKKLQVTRQQQRKSRATMPIVSIMGYTNVGKSTLFNAITNNNVLAEDKLFATLTPNVRKFAQNPKLLIADTVGFIRNFPPLLTNAFASTLEEIKYSRMIIHMRDIGMPLEERYSETVLDMIEKLGAGDVPRLTVWSKWDDPDAPQPETGICVSVKTGFGMEKLLEKLREMAPPHEIPEILEKEEHDENL